jgi:hypothetical protein
MAFSGSKSPKGDMTEASKAVIERKIKAMEYRKRQGEIL